MTIRVEGQENSGVIKARIQVQGATDRPSLEEKINGLLRDFAVEREVVWE